MPRRAASSFHRDAFNLPNILTMGRIVIIPVVLWLLVPGGLISAAFLAAARGTA